MSFRHRLIPLAALLALGGCNTANSTIGSGDTRFGEAAKYNAAVQTINPDPVYAADGALPGDSGAKAAAATKRYRTDAVKPLQRESTSQSSGGGSGGSGGGSGSGPQ